MAETTRNLLQILFDTALAHALPWRCLSEKKSGLFSKLTARGHAGGKKFFYSHMSIPSRVRLPASFSRN